METSWQELVGWYVLQFLAVTFLGWGAPFVSAGVLSILFHHGGSNAPLQISAAAAGALFALLVTKVRPELLSRWVWVPTGLCLIATLVDAGLMDAGVLKPDPWVHYGSHLREAWDSYFSTTRCGNDECLAQLILTMPFYSALAYSVAGTIAPRSVELTKRHIIIFAVLLVAASAIWVGLEQYREHVRCATRNAAFREQMEKLSNDAHDHLRIGTQKDQVVRFFEERQMRVTFGLGKLSGDFQAMGCAPIGCGADTATIGISVAIDSQGRVSGEPHVSGIYTDCL